MTQVSPPSSQARRAKVASFVGTTMEWYDFNIYATASALVFGTLFFPALAPGIGILASFATLGVGYLARPLGALIFGHIGDRIGRKRGLVVTMLMMGIATVGVGLLPAYQTIGILAPIALVVLRMVQGIAVGGEWGGAVSISAEHAGKSGRYSAGTWVQQGAPAGNVLATLVFLLVTLLPTDDFMTWGWRLPFLGSAVLIVWGMIVRVNLDESPEFVSEVRHSSVPKAPLSVVFRNFKLLILVAAMSGAAVLTGYSFVNVFALSWATSEVGLPRSSMLTALFIMSIVQVCIQPLVPVLARRWSPISVWVGSQLVAVVAVPLGYLLVASGQVALATVGLCVQIIPLSIGYVLLAGLLVEAFPTEIRYSAIGLSYNIGAMVFASTVPIIAAVLLGATGSIWSVSAFQVLYVLIGLVSAVILSRKTGAGRHQEAKPAAVAVSA